MMQRRCSQCQVVEELHPLVALDPLSWTQCYCVIVCIQVTCELGDSDLWMWILWYLLTYPVWRKLLAILWGEQWWWEYACSLKWKSHILWPSPWLFYQKVILVSLSFARGQDWTLAFSLWHRIQLAVIFPDVLIHAFPVVLTFYEGSMYE